MEHTKGEKWKVSEHNPVRIINDAGADIASTGVPIITKRSALDAQLIAATPETKRQRDALLDALKGDNELNAQAILSQALLGDYATVKVMLSALCSIHAKVISEAEKG